MTTDEPTPTAKVTTARQIVVPMDRSPASLKAASVAASLARGLRVGLRLMSSSFSTDGVEDLARLRATADQLGLAGAQCEVVPDEFPAQAIVELSHRPGVEAICMATFAHGVMPNTLGGVADEVVHDTSAPVVLIGPTVGEDPPPIDARPIVVTLDGSAAAASILPLVVRWASRFDGRVHLATVDAGDGARCSSAQLAEAVAVMTRGGAEVAAHRLEGPDVAGTLLGFADAVGAGLIALSPTGHGGAMNRALGYVATDIVRRAPIPVLVRRPSGSKGA